jgi:hypothetical protein
MNDKLRVGDLIGNTFRLIHGTTGFEPKERFNIPLYESAGALRVIAELKKDDVGVVLEITHVASMQYVKILVDCATGWTPAAYIYLIQRKSLTTSS